MNGTKRVVRDITAMLPPIQTPLEHNNCKLQTQALLRFRSRKSLVHTYAYLKAVLPLIKPIPRHHLMPLKHTAIYKLQHQFIALTPAI